MEHKCHDKSCADDTTSFTDDLNKEIIVNEQLYNQIARNETHHIIEKLLKTCYDILEDRGQYTDKESVDEIRDHVNFDLDLFDDADDE